MCWCFKCIIIHMLGSLLSFKMLSLSFNCRSFQLCEYGWNQNNWTWIIHVCDSCICPCERLYHRYRVVMNMNEWVKSEIMQDSKVSRTQRYYLFRKILGNLKTRPFFCGLLFPLAIHSSPSDFSSLVALDHQCQKIQCKQESETQVMQRTAFKARTSHQRCYAM